MSDACVRTSDALRLVAEKIECIKPKQIKDIAWCIATLENAASQMDSISDEIYELRQQLSASQRRADAAVEDLNGTGACFTCKHFRRNGGDCFGAGRCRLDGIEIWPCNEPGVYRAEVPDDGRQTYEWRGPVAGIGEAK